MRARSGRCSAAQRRAARPLPQTPDEPGPPADCGGPARKLPAVSTFPVTRLRRLRRTAPLRDLVRETRLDLDQFVMPLFVGPDTQRNELLPPLGRFSVDDVVREVRGARAPRREGGDPLRHPRREGRRGLGRVDRRRRRAAGAARAASALPGAAAAHRRLPLRVHVARPLRRDPRRRGRQRRDARRCSRARPSRTSRPEPTSSARAT